LEQLYTTYHFAVERHLNDLLKGSEGALADAMRYTLLGKGKRLRPQLVLASVETLGGQFSDALSFACAVEMVHAYSLIHDDLPCMDNDDFRRGQPTLHRVFPEGIAVLAGDALLTEAFRVISQSNHLSDRQIVRLIALLASRIGKDGMVGGQAIDILSKGKTVSRELLIEMDQKKTGDLFSCSLEFGAIIMNASSSIEEHLHQAGLHLGLAYQIHDDLEDAGVAASTNSIEPKLTLTTLIGIETTQKLLLQTFEKVQHHLSFLPSGAPKIKGLIEPIFK